MKSFQFAFVAACAIVAFSAATAHANTCSWNGQQGIALTNPNNNPIISNANVVLDFWGAYWTTANGTVDKNKIVANTNKMLGNPAFWSRMGQYGITGGSLNAKVYQDQSDLNPPAGTTQTLPSGTATNSVRSRLTNEIRPIPGLPAGGSTIDIVFLPPYVFSLDDPGGASCCHAYHSAFSFLRNVRQAVNVVYGVIEYSTFGSNSTSPCNPKTTVQGFCPPPGGFSPPPTGKQGDPGDASTETDLIGHEVMEAATDPYGSEGKIAFNVSGTTTEIADMCDTTNQSTEWVDDVRWPQSWLQDQCRCDGNPYPSLNIQASPTWMSVPGAASDVGSGWVIGTAPIGNDYGIYQYNPGAKSYTQFTVGGAAARKVSVDFNGNPWVVNSPGQIYKWIVNTDGTEQFSAFNTQVFQGNTFQAISVASGAIDSQTWAVDTNFQIYNWNGSSWQIIPNSFASKVAVYSQTNPDDGCNGSGLIYNGPPPFVEGTDGNIYRYMCNTNSFKFAGAGPDLTTDFAVGWDGVIYRWCATNSGCSWAGSTIFGYFGYPTNGNTSPPLLGPWGTDTRIGGWSNALFATSATTGAIEVITGQ